MTKQPAVFGIAALTMLSLSVVACDGNDDVGESHPDAADACVTGCTDTENLVDSFIVDSSPDVRDAAPEVSDVAPEAPSEIGPIAGDVYVDSLLGLDTNAGTVDAPFKTFTKATAKAIAPHSIWVVSRTYNPASEGPSTAIDVPDGVTVRAVGLPSPVIEGLAFGLKGASGGIDGLTFDKSATVTVSNTTADAPLVTLSNLRFLNGVTYNTTLTVSGKTKVLFTNAEITGNLRSPQVYLLGTSELVMKTCILDGESIPISSAFGAGLITVAHSSKLTLDGVTIKNAGQSALQLNGNSATAPVQVTLTGGTVIDNIGNAGNCGANAAIVITENAKLVATTTTIKNGKGGGICVRGGTGTNVAIDLGTGVVLDNDVGGLGAELGSGSDATIVIDGATITNNTTSGIEWYGQGSIDVRNTTLTGNGLAFDLRPLVALKATLRGNTISGNGYGIQTYDPSGLMTLDLGTTALPGGNTFTASTTTGIKLITAPLQVVSASGNTWNAGAQGADASGHYAAGSAATGPVATGTNYQLTTTTHLDL